MDIIMLFRVLVSQLAETQGKKIMNPCFFLISNKNAQYFHSFARAAKLKCCEMQFCPKRPRKNSKGVSLLIFMSFLFFIFIFIF